MSAEQPEKGPEELLDSVANLDTARMTLRWALERMRMLESGQGEMRELLKAAALGREDAVKELERFRLSVDERLTRLAERERFVAEMQGILNSLFKGELQVEEFVRRRQDLEKTQEVLEAKVRKRLAEAEEAHKRELEGHARMLSEMEGTYTRALAEAQARYHGELEAREESAREAVETERAKAERAREDALAEIRLQSDQSHQKALLLEQETARRRAAFEEDLGRLRARLQEEHDLALARERDLHAALRAGIEGEKRQLEAELSLRADRFAELRQALADAEAAAASREEAAVRKAEEAFARERSDLHARIEALRLESEGVAVRLAGEISALKADLSRQGDVLAAERERVLAEQAELRRRQEDRHAADLDALRGQLSSWQQRVLVDQASLSGEFQRRVEEREAELLRRAEERENGLREEHSLELRRLREEHDERAGRLGAELSAMRERHERELGDRAEEARRLADSLRTAAGEREGAGAAELARLRDAHRAELDRFAEELRRQREDFRAERRAISVEIEKEREAAAASHAVAFQSLEKTFAERTRRMLESQDEALRALDASHRARETEMRRAGDEESAALRAELAAARGGFEVERAALLEEQTNIRREDLAKFEEALHGVERFFLERSNERLRETVEQVEEARRGYSKLFAVQKHEAETEIARLRRQVSELKAELARRPPSPDGVLPDVDAEDRPRRWLRRFAVLALAAGLAAAAVRALGLQGADYAVPFSHPTAMLWEGDVLWVADASENALYRLHLSPEGMVSEARFPVQGVRLSGFTRANGTVFVLDADARALSRMRVQDGALLPERSWPAGGSRPSAVVYDGRDLWVADAADRVLRRRALDDALTPLEERPLALAPAALAQRDGALWAADAAGRLRSPTDPAGSSSADLRAPLPDDAAPLSALAWRGETLWFSRDGVYQLHARPLWRLRPLPWRRASATLTPDGGMD
ncbi:MAG: hypothetical protein WC969_05505 [Elusimicrobiota bacterium]|jgi:hypothetical protein